VAVAVAREDGYETTHSLTVSYGQRHAKEVLAAKGISKHYGLHHTEMEIPLAGVIPQGSALLNPTETLPLDRALSAMTARVPRTYVPGRNTVLLALAQSIAEVYNLDTIVVGFNAVDFSGYPDCRPIFVSAWNHLARVATRRGYQDNDPILVYAPVINMSKASVVAAGVRLQAPLHLTWSCYAGGRNACGRCDSCRIRLDAFKENGVEDPIQYAEV
jgi:7-cyano-7-deazaguanine synthase